MYQHKASQKQHKMDSQLVERQLEEELAAPVLRRGATRLVKSKLSYKLGSLMMHTSRTNALKEKHRQELQDSADTVNNIDRNLQELEKYQQTFQNNARKWHSNTRRELNVEYLTSEQSALSGVQRLRKMKKKG